MVLKWSIAVGVVVARSMGLDALVGLAMVVCAGGAGLASGITNPFNIGIFIQLFICCNVRQAFLVTFYNDT